MHDSTSFGRWLKQRRHALDLTQEQLATRAGCATETVRKLEAGGRRASKVVAQRLADALGLTSAQRDEFVRLARGRASVSAARARGAEQHPSSAMTEHMDPAPLLATKLYVPRPRASLVVRPRLIAQLEAGLRGPLTVIAAPAGFGKTTLLADWLSHAPTGRPVAWLSLDGDDSDPTTFLRYLIAALQTNAPVIGAAVLPLLRSAQPPSPGSVLPMLANDLAALPEDSVLVLDDYHVVEAAAVHQALGFLLEHLPPQLHVVLASRADPPLPLARWRARGLLTELRAHDLRCTTEEAAAFLTEVMEVPLTADDVAAVEARTEGWIAGLQLAALSLQHRPAAELSAFIDTFTGSHRFVVDYLIDEVLARQPPDIQSFLLHTSILERLCAPLCDAVMDAEPVAPAWDEQRRDRVVRDSPLAHVERRNLFLVALDDERRWYRYHHLFAHVLRERLASSAGAATVVALHLRASAWYAAQGLVADAVHHALAAQDWGRAADLIETDGRQLLVRGQVHTVLSWLSRLPLSFARARPALQVVHAAALFCINQLEAAEQRVVEATAALSPSAHDEQTRTFLAIATGVRAYIAYFRGDLTAWLSLSHDELQLVPAAELLSHNFARLNLAASFLLSGAVTATNEHRLTAAVAAVRATDDRLTLFHGLITLADFQHRQGRLQQAARSYRQAASVAPESGGVQVVHNGAAYFFGLGGILYEWNERDTAAPLLAQGRELVCAGRIGAAEAVSRGYLALVRVAEARGEHSSAVALLDEFDVVARERNFAAYLLDRAAAARAQLALARGELATAVAWARARDVGVGATLDYPREYEYLTLAHVRIAQARHAPAQPHAAAAVQLLDSLLAAAEADSRIDTVVQVLVLRALAAMAGGDMHAAVTDLERAIVVAAPETYVRVFVDHGAAMATLLAAALERPAWGTLDQRGDPGVRSYAQQLLAALQAELRTHGSAPNSALRAPSAAQPLGEPMTAREHEVLRLLAEGRSNAAIAAELVVAVGTVKRHVNSIMSKLQASSRLAAVVRARELDLLEPRRPAR